MRFIKIVLNNKNVIAEITNFNIAILNSCKISSIKEMKKIIDTLRDKLPTHPTLKRSNLSLINEWRAHNLLYSLKIKETNTITVDLNSNPSWYETLGYLLLSLLYIKY